MATLTIKQIKAALKRLEGGWPCDGTMIMANGNALYLCTKHPESGGKVIDSFEIPNDGGDPDWSDGDTDKRLVKFSPPRPSFIRG